MTLYENIKINMFIEYCLESYRGFKKEGTYYEVAGDRVIIYFSDFENNNHRYDFDLYEIKFKKY